MVNIVLRIPIQRLTTSDVKKNVHASLRDLLGTGVPDSLNALNYFLEKVIGFCVQFRCF
jgi:hypothetical protein